MKLIMTLAISIGVGYLIGVVVSISGASLDRIIGVTIVGLVLWIFLRGVMDLT
jgi:hypothetical protein